VKPDGVLVAHPHHAWSHFRNPDSESEPSTRSRHHGAMFTHLANESKGVGLLLSTLSHQLENRYIRRSDYSEYSHYLI
jgi:hypothetical protein